MTRRKCELLIGNKDLESTNGEIVGHACGGASVDAFVHLSPLIFLWTFVHFSHTCSKLSCSIVLTKSHVSTFCQSDQIYYGTQIDKVNFMTTITTILIMKSSNLFAIFL